MTGSASRLRFGVLWVLCVALACSRGQADARSAEAPQAPGSYGYSYENAPAEPAIAEEGMPAPPAMAPAPAPEAPAGGPIGLTQASGGDAASPAPAAPNGVTSSAPGGAAQAPLLIYSATLTLAVFGAEAALDAVERLARERRGYLVRRSDTSITIRVPAEAFQEALDGVGALGDELHRDVSARDVTEEFADLAIRLRNSEVVRQRLEALLSKVAKVEEALAVERELERVTRDIEQIKGKLKLLGELIRFSTITVNFQPRPVETVARDRPLPFPWLERLGLSHLLNL